MGACEEARNGPWNMRALSHRLVDKSIPLNLIETVAIRLFATTCARPHSVPLERSNPRTGMYYVTQSDGQRCSPRTRQWRNEKRDGGSGSTPFKKRPWTDGPQVAPTNAREREGRNLLIDQSVTRGKSHVTADRAATRRDGRTNERMDGWAAVRHTHDDDDDDGTRLATRQGTRRGKRGATRERMGTHTRQERRGRSKRQ